MINCYLIRSYLYLSLFLFRNPLTRLVIIIYCTYSFAVIGFDEVYSLWCAAPGYLGNNTSYNTKSCIVISLTGGLRFSLHDIGISLSIVGALLLPFTLFFYPFVSYSTMFFKIYFIIA